MRLKKILLGSVVLLVLLALVGFVYLRSLGMFSIEPVYQTDAGAIDGYDPVAYFTLGKPTPGSAEFTHEWNGATWRFASKEHLELFAADPEKYAPQFGGYCAFAVSENYTARTDPQAAWTIVDNRLYLNFDPDVAAQWAAGRAERITAASRNWPGVLVGS